MTVPVLGMRATTYKCSYPSPCIARAKRPRMSLMISGGGKRLLFLTLPTIID